MSAFTGRVEKPSRRTVAKKKTGQAQAEDTKKILETNLAEMVQNVSGLTLDPSAIEKILKDLKIDPSVPLSDGDKFLLYNVLMEPVVPFIKETENESDYVIDTEQITEDAYLDTVESVSSELTQIIPSNRVIGLYDVLPSMKINRINFDIEKDIFRNKPLLGKGLFKCKYCGSDNTEDYEIQTRRADEGAWVRVNCRDCTKTYIIT